MNQISMETGANKESNETKFIKIGLKIRKKSLLGNQQKSVMKFWENEEFLVFKTLITYLNLI